MALSPFVLLPAVLLQANSVGQPSGELEQLVLKLPDKGGFIRCSYDAVSLLLDLSVERRSPSPESKMGLPPVIRPEYVRANPPCLTNRELDGLVLPKPPDNRDLKQCPCDAVSTSIHISSDVQYSLEHEVALIPPIPETVGWDITLVLGSLGKLLRMMWVLCVITFCAIKDREAEEMQYTIIHEYIEDDETPTSAWVLPTHPPAHLLGMHNPRYPSLERVARILKPPIRVAYTRWFLYEIVNTLNKRTYSVSYLGGNATMPPSFPTFLVSVALASHCGSWMPDDTLSAFARCCLWTA